MDRKKKDELPKMQVGFIDFVCMPLYKVLTNLIPDLQPLLDGVKGNRDNWQTLVDDPKGECDSVPFCNKSSQCILFLLVQLL